MLEIFKNYLSKEDYYIIVYSSYIYIYKYIEIKKFTDNYISLQLNNLVINITGSNMLITKLEKEEILIKGTIHKLEKIYE